MGSCYSLDIIIEENCYSLAVDIPLDECSYDLKLDIPELKDDEDDEDDKHDEDDENDEYDEDEHDEYLDPNKTDDDYFKEIKAHKEPPKQGGTHHFKKANKIHAITWLTDGGKKYLILGCETYYDEAGDYHYDCLVKMEFKTHPMDGTFEKLEESEIGENKEYRSYYFVSGLTVYNSATEENNTIVDHSIGYGNNDNFAYYDVSLNLTLIAGGGSNAFTPLYDKNSRYTIDANEKKYYYYDHLSGDNADDDYEDCVCYYPTHYYTSWSEWVNVMYHRTELRRSFCEGVYEARPIVDFPAEDACAWCGDAPYNVSNIRYCRDFFNIAGNGLVYGNVRNIEPFYRYSDKQQKIHVSYFIGCTADTYYNNDDAHLVSTKNFQTSGGNVFSTGFGEDVSIIKHGHINRANLNIYGAKDSTLIGDFIYYVTGDNVISWEPY